MLCHSNTKTCFHTKMKPSYTASNSIKTTIKTSTHTTTITIITTSISDFIILIINTMTK